MGRKTLFELVGLMIVLFLAVSLSHAQPVMDYSGTYDCQVTGDDSVTGTMWIEQSGSDVTVEASWDPNVLTGTVDGNVMALGHEGLSCVLTFADDGQSFTGTWAFDTGTSGTITGTKRAVDEEDQGSIRRGYIQEHPSTGSHPYTYYTYVPNSISNQDTSEILVLCHGGTFPIGDYDSTKRTARSCVSRHSNHAETSRFILLCMAVPRDFGFYSQPLNRECFTSDNEFHRRPDLKLIDVINEYRVLLEDSGYTLENKILITGFSSGGAFAPRFTFLHPDMVRAVGVGGQGGIIWPLTEYEGDPLTYPVGVYDLEELTGSAFNLEALQSIGFRTFIGAEDTKPENDLVSPGENYTQEQVDQINRYFGTNPPERAENFHNTLLSLGIDSEFKAYPGVGHEYTDEMKDDLFTFLDTHRRAQKTNGGNGCFIATAAYGTPLACEVKILSEFRDKILLESRLGSQFVKAYYNLSPPCARFIAKHSALRTILRVWLRPILKVSEILVENKKAAEHVLKKD